MSNTLGSVPEPSDFWELRIPEKYVSEFTVKFRVKGKTYRRFKIKIIQPPYTVGGTLDARPEIITAWRKLGYETAKKETSIQEWNV